MTFCSVRLEFGKLFLGTKMNIIGATFFMYIHKNFLCVYPKPETYFYKITIIRVYTFVTKMVGRNLP